MQESKPGARKAAGHRQEVLLAARISRERKKELKHWLLSHGEMSVQEFIDNAINSALSLKADQEAIIEGNKRLSGKFPSGSKKITSAGTVSAYNLNNPTFREWVDWLVMAMNSKHESALLGITANIQWVLADLALLQDEMARDEIDKEAQARILTPANYAGAARAARLAFEQLRRAFENQRHQAL